jgi:hypothetical protein
MHFLAILPDIERRKPGRAAESIPVAPAVKETVHFILELMQLVPHRIERLPA